MAVAAPPEGSVRATLPRAQRAARFAGDGAIAHVERAIPEPGAGELLLRVSASALCGTDRHLLSSGQAVTPGHEIAGEVVRAGPGTDTAEGATGLVYLMVFCGTCPQCRSGATNQCVAKDGDIGFTRDGGHADYVAVPERCFFPVDPGIPAADATLLLDVMSTTAHALRRAAGVRDEVRSVFVAGAGPVGLGVVAMTRLLLGSDVRVVVADLVPYRLELAVRLGATAVDLARQSLPEALRALGLAGDVDVAIDTAGRESSRRLLLDSLGRGGVLVCVGHGEGLTLAVSDDLIGPERTVMGSEYFRYDELARGLDVLRENREYLGRIVTHRFPLSELDRAYAAFLAGETGKVVIEP